MSHYVQSKKTLVESKGKSNLFVAKLLVGQTVNTGEADIFGDEFQMDIKEDMKETRELNEHLSKKSGGQSPDRSPNNNLLKVAIQNDVGIPVSLTGSGREVPKRRASQRVIATEQKLEEKKAQEEGKVDFKDIKTKGNESLDDREDYNIYLDASELMVQYLHTGYKIDNVSDLMKHYLTSEIFVSHPCMELIMKIYAFLRNLETSQKFRGYMKKRTDEMKEAFWHMPNISALCSQEELEIYKLKAKKGIKPVVVEDITIFCFINDVCQSVEIINKNNENCRAFYPMLPKVYFLSQKSLKSFREECRIEQSTTKLVDLMNYINQFEVEMDLNYDVYRK